MYYKYDNIKIYYEYFSGKNNNIIILPGWGDTRNTFYNVINYLKNEYSIYIVDYPSFGNSPIPTKSLTIYDYAKIIKHFIIDLEIENPLIIAHSFGGRIATILTGYYNFNINKMIYIDTAGIKHRKSFKCLFKEKIYKFLRIIIQKLFRKNKEQKLKKLRQIFGSSDYGNLCNEMLETFKNVVNEDLAPYYKNIKSKVLIIWGKKDTDTPYKDALYMKKSIKKAELITFNEGNHFTYLQYPYNINLIIDSFIKEKDTP